MNIHEYQAKAHSGRIRRAVRAGRRGVHAGGSRRRGQGAWRPGVGGQGADPRWRPRQGQVQGAGSRRQGRRAAGASSVDEVRQFADEMLAHTLVTHQTGPDGRVVKRLYIEDGSDDCARALSFRAGGPRHVAHRLHRLDRRRHGHRGSGPRTPEKILTLTIDPAAGFRVPRPQGRLRAGPEGRSGQAVREADRRPLPGLHREGHEPA